MTRTTKLTHDEIVARCLANGYAWPDGLVYQNCNKKYPLICLTCGDNTPKRFKEVGWSGCKTCANLAKSLAYRFTQDEVEERCLDNNYAWPDGFIYKNRDTKYPLICLTCGDNRPKLFTNVGKKGCVKCANLAKSLAFRFTQNEAVAQGLAAKHPALLLEEYKGSVVKQLYRFVACGHEHETTLHNLNGGDGCGACRFDQGSTQLYLMRHKRLAAFKIGVTQAEHENPTDSRIYRHGREGWTLTLSVRFETRAEALKAEKTIIDCWREQGFPPALTPEQMKRRGEGETVSTENVTARSIKEMMWSLRYPVRSWDTTSNASTMAAVAEHA
jgi:hypothetical protein